MSQTVLVVEDEQPIQELFRLTLGKANFQVMLASDSEEAQLCLSKKIPDVILLDWMLPKKSGIDFIKKLKSNNHWKNIPIIMVTAKAEENNKISALELGADDYITKPFSPREVIARIKVVLRRGIVADPDGIIHFGKLSINQTNHLVFVDQKQLKLSPIEYRLLHFFMTHPGKVLTRIQILDYVWSGDVEICDRTVDVHMRRLRNKLKVYDLHLLITTIHGIGYQFGEST